MAVLIRILRALPLLVISPVLLAGSVLGLAVADLVALMRPKRPPRETQASATAASVVIPNWNGRDLLEKYLPSVETALSGNPENEIIVVDNGSTDGSVNFLRRNFPAVKVIARPANLGFGEGSNLGFRQARNDVVVLLNNDMRVDAGFLPPLLEGFADKTVFAVSCQIFFTDPQKIREETGLTQGWWQDGALRVRHRVDPEIKDLYPCFYGGGGSCAFDRHKFLELGGFDSLLAPFYLEDTDLGYLAWKRGWKVLYQPRSVVYHEHRGTIGARFTEQQIQAVLKKNFLLFCWKNIHDWRQLASHFLFAYAGALVSLGFGDTPGRANLAAYGRAFLQLPSAMRSRLRARGLAVIGDAEAFARPLGGYFRDRFADLETVPERLRVLFVSPYPICPPVHGGGVFMYQTLRELSRRCEVHVLALLDDSSQLDANAELRRICASAEFLVRLESGSRSTGSILPHAVSEFWHPDLEWAIHRQLFLKQIDVLQLEYMPLGQYTGRYRRIVTALFEHDVYFQSIARGVRFQSGALQRLKARFEYLRALRYEVRLLSQCHQVQVCTRENKQLLESFAPALAPPILDGLRAGIDTARYRFRSHGRKSFTMLFLGSFRHLPNQVAIDWFSREVLPLILARRPQARLVIAGSDPPPAHTFAGMSEAIEILGFVEDIRPLLASCGVFICPVLNGSGVRVKLLEAFASGIPVVSTRIGAEGLAREDGEFCFLADEPGAFADRVISVFDYPVRATEMAARAHAEVLANWDVAEITKKLELSYRAALEVNRPGRASNLSESTRSTYQRASS